MPYVEGIGNADLAKILDDENEVLVEFRSSIRTLISQAKQDQGKIDQILNDVVRPKVAMLDRQFRRITNMNRLKIGGAAVSTATIGLVSYLTTGVAAGITAVAGVSGLVYLTKEMAGGISDLSALKDDPASYLLWKLKRFQAGKD
ncbi:MAG TPA: hypothetical protein VEM36_06715 [Xanthobacteraceae bacterium]|nr:hypothetical protein [Xanthobacteraceae bacterium]